MNRSEQEMADWLAHPMEFGEAPEEVQEIHRERTQWPLLDDEVELVFHRYRTKDGFTSIGMTGPITWSFLGDDLRGFTMGELKRLYAGWYINFAAVNSSGYSVEQNRREKESLAKQLRETLEGFVKIVDYVRAGELVFYAYRARRDRQEVVVATDTAEDLVYEPESKYLRLPPLYYFMGAWFFEDQF